MARVPLALLLLGVALLGAALPARAAHGQATRDKPLVLNQRSSKSVARQARHSRPGGSTGTQRKQPASVGGGVFEGRSGRGSATVAASYIVEVCDGADQQALLDLIAAQHADESQPQWRGRTKHVYRSVLRGMALEGVSAVALEELLRLASVCGVAEVGVARKSGTKSWGINRIDQPALPLDGSYTPTDPEGLNVSVFVLDTGLDTTHDEFSGSARTVANVWDAYDSTPDKNNDVDGHGSHCAGTVGGLTVGVAPLANLYGVKVLGDDGSGSYSDIIAGIDFVVGNATSPAVISMSLGGSYYSVLNDAVDSAVDAGVTVVVAAGNSADDACSYSPASAYSAVTVGSTTRHDHVSWFSNYGECVDIYGPGSDITSVDTGTNYSYANLSGTSMACPHVAGVAALVLSGVDSSYTPDEVAQYLDCTAEAGLLDTVEYSYWSDDSDRSLLQVPDLNATCNVSNSTTPYFDIVGDCTRSGACFYSPNYPSDYDSGSICFIYPTEEATLSVTSFDLEDESSCSYDYLSVDGTLYCGTSGPDGVSVDSDSTLLFYADSSVTGGGFEICLAGSPTPSPTSPQPTPSPTISAAPTVSFQPTGVPTPAPTPVPTVSLAPTNSPTMAPSACGKACADDDFWSVDDGWSDDDPSDDDSGTTLLVILLLVLVTGVVIVAVTIGSCLVCESCPMYQGEGAAHQPQHIGVEAAPGAQPQLPANTATAAAHHPPSLPVVTATVVGAADATHYEMVTLQATKVPGQV